MIQADIPGGRQPLIFLGKNADSRVIPGILEADLPAAVGAAVINQDNLKVLVGLVYDTV